MVVSYTKQLAALQQAMIAGDRATMLPLIAQARHNEFPPESRLNVYTDGYEMRLFDAVRVDFPALEHYLGTAAFGALLREYIHATPSVFWDLNLYSLPFVDFICGAFAASHPAACALAVLETAIIEVFWLPESDAWQPSAETLPEALMEQNLPLRAASKLLRLSHPAEQYLAVFRREENPTMPEAATSFMFLVRHQNEVKRHLLTAEEHSALTKLGQGMTLAEALEAARSIEEAQEWFGRWIAKGFLRG